MMILRQKEWSFSNEASCKNIVRGDRKNRTVNGRERPSVSFERQVQFREICHLNDFSDEDFAASFYSPDDYQAIKEVCIFTVKMMMNGVPVDDDDSEICYRGMVRSLIGNLHAMNALGSCLSLPAKGM